MKKAICALGLFVTMFCAVNLKASTSDYQYVVVYQNGVKYTYVYDGVVLRGVYTDDNF